MNKSKLLVSFSVINFICVFIAILNMPQIVVYKVSNNLMVESMISRWYDIIIPTIALISCIIILFIDINQNNSIKHTYRYIVTYVAICIASYVSWILIAIQLNFAVLDFVVLPITIIVTFPVALFMLVSGYYGLNSKFLSSTIYNFSWLNISPIAWRKTHKVGSGTAIILSLLLIVLAIFNDVSIRFNYMLIILLVLIILQYLFVVLYSRLVVRDYK